MSKKCARAQSRTAISCFSDTRRDHLGYPGNSSHKFVDPEGIEPSPGFYKNPILAVKIRVHYCIKIISNFFKLGSVDLPRIELGSWQCECHILPLNHRPLKITSNFQG